MTMSWPCYPSILASLNFTIFPGSQGIKRPNIEKTNIITVLQASWVNSYERGQNLRRFDGLALAFQRSAVGGCPAIKYPVLCDIYW